LTYEEIASFCLGHKFGDEDASKLLGFIEKENIDLMAQKELGVTDEDVKRVSKDDEQVTFDSIKANLEKSLSAEATETQEDEEEDEGVKVVERN